MANSESKATATVIRLFNLAAAIVGTIYTLPALYHAFVQPVFHSAEPTRNQWLGLWCIGGLFFASTSSINKADKVGVTQVEVALTEGVAVGVKLLLTWCFIWLFR